MDASKQRWTPTHWHAKMDASTLASHGDNMDIASLGCQQTGNSLRASKLAREKTGTTFFQARARASASPRPELS